MTLRAPSLLPERARRRRGGRRSAPRLAGRLLPLLLALATTACVSSAPRLRAVPAGYSGSLVTWWADGAKKEEGTYREGKRHGDVRAYHPEGGLVFEGRFEDGVPVGAITRYHEGGAVAVTEFVRDGVLDGERVEYDESGRRSASVVYARGGKHGEETRWTDGVRVLAGRWDRGVPVGRWRYWRPDGSIEREERYWITDGQPAGYLETVYSEEGVASVQTLRTRREGAWRGWRTFWHDNGRQAGLVELVDGRRHGRDVSWDREGHVVSEGTRRADRRVGLWNFWRGEDRVAEQVDYGVPDEADGGAGDRPAPRDGEGAETG